MLLQLEFAAGSDLSTWVEVGEEAPTSPDIALEVLDPVLVQAPTSLMVVLHSTEERAEVTFRIDGVVVDTAVTDTDGSAGPMSIAVPSEVGQQGSHTVTASIGSLTASATFTLRRNAVVFNVVRGLDAAAVFIPGSEGRWVLQDLMPGGAGSWVMPINPSKMTFPHVQRTVSAQHTTAQTGKYHVFEAAPSPLEWKFSGYLANQEQHDRLMQFYALNRRFYVIDHRGRAWKSAFIHVDMVPRLRHLGLDGVATDWGHDYTVTALVFDQDWTTPQ